MGIFDTVILDESIELSNFPFNPSHAELNGGNRRLWQTKDLNPSMDTYGILPKLRHSLGKIEVQDSQDLYLYRRHPPITKWTHENRGNIGEEYPDDILNEADHWRNVRYTGTMTISETTEDTTLYSVEIELDSGVVQNINIVDKIESPVDGVFPPKYMEIIDIDDHEATYQGRKVSDIAEDYYDGEDIDISDEHLGMILTFYQTRTINGGIPDYDELFEYKGDTAYYENKPINAWVQEINNDEHDLDEYEERAIELYSSLQRDKDFIESSNQ